MSGSFFAKGVRTEGELDGAAVRKTKGLVRKEGLEPSRFYPPDPKSGASANSATFATLLIIQSDRSYFGLYGEPICGQVSPHWGGDSEANRASTTGEPRWRVPRTGSGLLYGVESLIDEHAGEHQQEHAESGAENPDRDGQPVHLRDQLRLLLLHVRARVVEIQRLILVHGERAAVDEKDNQADCEKTTRNRKSNH
jgi:hypothetical protein